VLRVLARGISALFGGILLIAGGFGLLIGQLPDEPATQSAREVLRGLYTAHLMPVVDRDWERVEGLISDPILAGGLSALAAVLLLSGLLPRRRRRLARRSAGGPSVPQVDRATRRRVHKQARTLVKSGSHAEAAELFFHAGLFDDAAELFVRAECLARAAEIRHDQNRFVEAAELHAKAGNYEAAGAIYAMQEQHIEAADAYLKASRIGVAAEMFEKAGEFARAGDCYMQSEFYRQAAQAYVRCKKWAEAADALDRLLAHRGLGEGRQQETRQLFLQAAKLYQQAKKLAEAEAILERGQCWREAAEIALKRERFSQAADLFQRAKEPLRAAEALRLFGEDTQAARVLGEYHRDKGDAEKAAEYLEQSGEFSEAGDLYRKLERFVKAGECFEQSHDAEHAAEMFSMVENWVRAGENFERGKKFVKAAECFALAGDHRREGELLERGGEFLQAGRLYHEHELDDEAIKALQRVEATSAEFNRACALLGEIFRAKGMYSLAIKKLRGAVDIDAPSRENVDAVYALATVCDLNGDHRDAVDLYEKILALDYHYKDVEQRLEEARSKVVAQPAGGVAGSDPAAAMPSTPGRYRILDELGRGGMGIVYKANDTVLDRTVAYKVLPDALQQSEQALKNFLREAKSAARLNHPNIVTVYDAGAQDGRYYIAMEYVDGTTLKEILRRRGVINPPGVIQVMAQMCEALAYAHAQKVVHRDIKTSNAMWTREKKAKVMDFGLAKVMEEVRNHTTLVSGTPYYMSPEQTLGQNVDHRTDIYSLGVTLFELATGRLPFQEGNVPYHHVHTPPPDPREFKPDLPDGLAAIIARCMQKDPAARFQNAGEIVSEARVLAGKLKGSTAG
jgi:tetratricopeptide (TPR) repeat protein